MSDEMERNVFDVPRVRACIEEVLIGSLKGRVYSDDLAEAWVHSITNQLHTQTKQMNLSRFKIIVSVTLCDCAHTEAAASSSRCIWDSDTDAYTSYTFKNDSIFCLGVVYGVYLY